VERDFETEELWDDEAQFRARQNRGIEQADRGEFIEAEEMDSRINARRRRAVPQGLSPFWQVASNVGAKAQTPAQ
jgi:hypothetical protein